MPIRMVRHDRQSYHLTGDDILDLTPRKPVRVPVKGNYWTCRCKRRHRVPNVVRCNFTCPSCGEKYHGA